MLVAVDFYSQLLVELVAAFGAALLVGNVVALVRRRPATAGASGSTLTRAPVVRSVAFAAIGLVMLVWGLASRFG